MRFLCSSLTILSVMLFAPDIANACVCVPRPNLQVRELVAGDAEKYDVIFEGRAESYEVGPVRLTLPDGTVIEDESKTLRFSVLRGYKGAKKDVIRVLADQSSCSYGFELGKSYLVYALSFGEDVVTTSICSRTQELEFAGPDLRYLRGEAPELEDLLSYEEYSKRDWERWQKTRGNLCGRVMRANGEPLQSAYALVWRLDGKQQHLPTNWEKTDRDGGFRFEDVEPGQVYLAAIDNLHTDAQSYVGFYGGGTRKEEAVPVEVEAGQEECGLNILLYPVPVARIRGVVKDASGHLPTAEVDVIVSAVSREPFLFDRRIAVATDGRFEFQFIPLGRYRLIAWYTPEGDEWRKSEEIEVELFHDKQVVLTLLPE